MKLEDHYPKSVTEFEALLSDAEDQCSGDMQTEFVKQIREKYSKWGGGMFMSTKQLNWLKKIAYDDSEPSYSAHNG